MTPVEGRILLAVAGVLPEARAKDCLSRLLRSSIDWRLLETLGAQHALIPLLHHRLQRLPEDLVPSEFRERLRGRYLENMRGNLAKSCELSRICKALASQGVPVLPYKGPMLALRIHDDLSLREFGDLDFLLKPRDFTRACGILKELGYRERPSGFSEGDEEHLARFGQLQFVHPERGIHVELHTAFAPRDLGVGYERADFWRKLRRTFLGGQEILELPPDELLLVLCVHGSKHMWITLAWIRDVALVMERHPDLDYAELIRRSRRLGYERMLLLGLALARRLLNTRLAEPLRAELRSQPQLSELVRAIESRLFLVTNLWPEGFYTLWFHWLVRERPRDSLRYGLSLAALPWPADTDLAESLGLPSSWGAVLRPIRLAGKCFRLLYDRIGRLGNSQ